MKQPATGKWLQGSISWELRPFWIVGDLRTAHDWLNATQPLTNQLFYRQSEALVHHYIRRLRAPGEQSFSMLCRNNFIAQFDITPAAQERMALHNPQVAGGYVLYYLLPHDQPQTIISGAFRYMIASLQDQLPLFVELPASETIVAAVLNELGAKKMDRYHTTQQPVVLYALFRIPVLP